MRKQGKGGTYRAQTYQKPNTRKRLFKYLTVQKFYNDMEKFNTITSENIKFIKVFCF